MAASLLFHERGQNAQRAYVAAQAVADAAEQAVTRTTDSILTRLEGAWNTQRRDAQADARIALEPAKRTGRGRHDAELNGDRQQGAEDREGRRRERDEIRWKLFDDALEIGLEDTFPASDPASSNQPAKSKPDKTHQ